MSLLHDVIAELEGALRQPEVPADVTDEQRIWALMVLAAKAEEGDEAAKAPMPAVEALFARAGCQKS
jgi:hypothetical protein